MSWILALDQSTSATKALLFDHTGRAVDREAQEHHQFYPQAGWVEHDAEEIWQNTLAVLGALLARHASIAREISCLSITNQRETIVVFERATGRPLFPAIVWQCRRSESICAAHVENGRGALIHERSGLRLDPYFSGSKLQWLVQNKPGLRAKLESGEALIGTMDTYLIYRLTSGKVFATDATNASRTLCYDVSRLRWDEELCELWEIPLRALPEVRDSTANFGETNLGGALARAVPICGVMGDSQASLFAQRCFEPGMAKVTFGTGSSVMLNIGKKMRFSECGVVTAIAWVHAGVPTYAFEGIIISSAATLTWLRDQLGLVRDIAEIETLARSVAESEGVYLVPAFSGLGLPYWQPTARAAIVGLSAQSDRRHVARAALESISYQLRDTLEIMRAEGEVPLLSLQADGGPTANQFLMQFTADLTAAKLRIATMADCSALGAALAGMLGCGIYRSLSDLAALPRSDIVYEPNMPGAQAQRLYAGWELAVRQVVPQTAAEKSGVLNS
jgi:glycerol kinase